MAPLVSPELVLNVPTMVGYWPTYLRLGQRLRRAEEHDAADIAFAVVVELIGMIPEPTRSVVAWSALGQSLCESGSDDNEHYRKELAELLGVSDSQP